MTDGGPDPGWLSVNDLRRLAAGRMTLLEALAWPDAGCA